LVLKVAHIASFVGCGVYGALKVEDSEKEGELKAKAFRLQRNFNQCYVNLRS